MTTGPLPTAPTVNSTLTWDAENRLTSTTVGSITTTTLFDAQSRRIAKSTGGNTTLYLYDAWNCIAEYSRSVGVSPTLQATRLWGTDLSGTLQGAGGVGGLLSESYISNPQSSIYYPTYDGNGNVSEYLAADGSVAAHFEYDSFGNTVVASGSVGLFGYRFSTKPRDSETGLYYYGYRYYDPVTGRWPSRDPIGEKGGWNLYGFVGNDGVNKWDYLGQIDCKSPEVKDPDCMERAKNSYDGALEKNENTYDLDLTKAHRISTARKETISVTYLSCVGYCSYLIISGAPYLACLASCTGVSLAAAVADIILLDVDLGNATDTKATNNANALVDYKTARKNCGCSCP